MHSRLPVIVICLVIATTASARVEYGFDPQAGLAGHHSVAWVPTPSTSIEQVAPQVHERMVETIQKKLTSGRLRMVYEAPKLNVTYHTNVSEELRLSVNEFGYEYSDTWDAVADTAARDVGPGDSPTVTYTYPRGTLVIDVWDAGRRQLIFRGAAADVFSDDPERFDAKMMRAIRKITAQFKELHKSWNKQKRASQVGGIDWPN